MRKGFASYHDASDLEELERKTRKSGYTIVSQLEIAKLIRQAKEIVKGKRESFEVKSTQ